jgi:hypothetical protein
MKPSELESKIFFAIKFIVRSFGIPDQVAIEAAQAAAREIVRFQKMHDQETGPGKEHHENLDQRTTHPASEGFLRET